MAPTRVAGDHKRLQARNGACQKAVIDFHLHPDTRQDGVERGIGRCQCRMQVMKPENDKHNDPNRDQQKFSITQRNIGLAYGNRTANAPTTNTLSRSGMRRP